MVEILRTRVFDRWLQGLRDRQARAAIEERIRRLSLGNPGDTRSVGQGIQELRIHSGPGYRVYYVRRGHTVIVLLAGGDKSSQRRDISRALELARTLEEV